MANSKSDDFATKDIRKTVVCDIGGLPPEFEAETSTMTEPDGTIANVSLNRLYVSQDGAVWEATPDNLKRRDDLGVCIPCWKPMVRPFWRRQPAKVIRSRDVLKACADCGRLFCRDHCVEFSSDSSHAVYRCLSCAVRHEVKRFRQFLFFRRA